ncbi:MAG: DUF2207 domain-containing protein [Chloroflexia bacterium]|nr:DUF2207 domain-containing protein [Chloroflexia bacterium]
MDPAEAWLHLFFIAAMLIVGIGGFVAIVILWYTRGRDPAIGVVADIIPEPPDDLPPGAAGTLLDERVHHRDVVATLLGLGRHGAIQIVDRAVDDPARGGALGHDYLLITRDPTKVASRLERDLLHVLFGHIPQPGEEIHLRDVKHRFDENEGEIREDLYQEMVDRGYFKRSPSETRRRWRRLAWFGLVSSLVIGIFLTARVDSFAILTTIAAVIIWAALLRMSTAMPKKTAIGAESAAKWRAFKRYLESIERHGALEEAQGIFDRYLSYAVAFGIERDWIRKFAQVGASSPGWFQEIGGPGGPGGYGRGGDVLVDTWMTGQMLGHLGGGPGGGASDAFGGNAGIPDIGMPDMPNMPDGGFQDVADIFGGGLQDTSEGLAGMLDEAGSVFDGIDFDF